MSRSTLYVHIIVLTDISYVHIIVLTPPLAGQGRVTVKTLCPYYCPNPLVEQTGCVVTSYSRPLGKGSMAEDGTDGLCCNTLKRTALSEPCTHAPAACCVEYCATYGELYVDVHPLYTKRLAENHVLMSTHRHTKDLQRIMC